jgi:hypothetical protein
MSDRLLTLLTVVHHGVPIATTQVVEREREQLIEPFLPSELRTTLDRTPWLIAREITLLPSFESVVRPLLRRHRAAEAAWRQTPSWSAPRSMSSRKHGMRYVA